MKLVKIIISFALIGMTAFAWITIGGSAIASNSGYEAFLAQAEKSMEAELYEDAYNNYTEALKLEPSEELAVKQVEAYTRFYQEEKEGDYGVRQQLISALDSARRAYPSNESFAVQEVDLYLEGQDFKAAKRVCQQALEANSKSEKLQESWHELVKSYTMEYLYYADFHEPVGDYYATTTGVNWQWLTRDGKKEGPDEYIMMGLIGQEGIFLAQEEGRGFRFYDMDGVARGRTDGTWLSAGVYQEGLCPVEKEENVWYYLNLDGKEILGPYRQAGCFLEGKAAVQEQDGSWYLIDAEGNRVSEAFADIRLDLGGAYANQGIMLAAKKDGSYSMYDSELKQVGDFTCDEMDLPTEDGLFAFCKDGKWGFVNAKGEVVLKPKYQQARSFRSGLAAVCQQGKWDFIKADGEQITQEQFYDVGYVTADGTAMVSDEDGFYRMLTFVFLQELVS